MRVVVSLVFVTSLMLLSSAPARAACSHVVDPAAEMADADSVFVGRVMAVSDFGRLATMEVLEIWKGSDLPSEVVVNGSSSGSDQIGANDRTFIAGNTYVVVPLGSRSPFFDQACSGTHLYVPAGAIPSRFQDAIGTDLPRIPGTPATEGTTSGDGSDGGSAFLLVGAVAGAFLVLGLVVRRRRKRRGSADPGRAASAPPPADPAQAQLPARQAEQRESEPADAANAVAAVAGRTRKRIRLFRGIARALSGILAKFRPGRSGLQNLESIRKKTRKIKEHGARTE